MSDITVIPGQIWWKLVKFRIHMNRKIRVQVCGLVTAVGKFRICAPVWRRYLPKSLMNSTESIRHFTKTQSLNGKIVDSQLYNITFFPPPAFLLQYVNFFSDKCQDGGEESFSAKLPLRLKSKLSLTMSLSRIGSAALSSSANLCLHKNWKRYWKNGKNFFEWKLTAYWQD